MKKIPAFNLLKGGGFIVFFAGLVYLIFFASMKQIQLGISPGQLIFGSTQPVFEKKPQEQLLPVTGGILNRDIIIMDDFSGERHSLSTVNGLLYYTGNEATLSPRTFVKGSLATLNMEISELPDSFAFSADLLTPWFGDQKSGLALNSKLKQSALLFLINPNNSTYSVGTWQDNTYALITEWKKSDAIHAVMEVNQLSVNCTDEKTEFYINGTLVEVTEIGHPCNEGVPGIFVADPAWFVAIDNMLLARLP